MCMSDLIELGRVGSGLVGSGSGRVLGRVGSSELVIKG